MDSGEVIPGLNENWTFAGANATEWMSGFIMFLISSEMFDKISRAMPILLLIWLLTTFALSFARRAFPDEERGLRNYLMVKVGLAPEGIPPAAELIPIFSGAPMRKRPEVSRYAELELDLAFAVNNTDRAEDDQSLDWKPTTPSAKSS